MSEKTVFVLGAGFTRAFVPDAPLLVDDYRISELRERFASFPYAKKVLDDSLSKRSDGRIDLERLMTRLSGMPYDADDARRELALLETILRKSLVKRINGAKAGRVEWEKIRGFARMVLEKRIVNRNF